MAKIRYYSEGSGGEDSGKSTHSDKWIGRSDKDNTQLRRQREREGKFNFGNGM